MRAFGIPENRVLAAEVRVANGLITSEITLVPTDEGKAEALRSVGLSAPDAVFGNSIHDLAMLEIAQHGVSGESVASSHGGCREARLGLLPSKGRGRPGSCCWWRVSRGSAYFF